eukprot:1161212-Pelagomonas_calceolata.AAC.13
MQTEATIEARSALEKAENDAANYVSINEAQLHFYAATSLPAPLECDMWKHSLCQQATQAQTCRFKTGAHSALAYIACTPNI